MICVPAWAMLEKTKLVKIFMRLEDVITEGGAAIWVCSVEFLDLRK
jgi:hypothetical protein